jgi:digeranylgeranylglycerophospholipid reductase
MYDLVVVGAGPAGSTAARAAAERGVDVLLVERELEVGVPDKCGEFIPALEEMRRLAPKAEDLEALFDPPSRFIVNRTSYVRFIFPNQVEITVPFKGLVVERKLYDKHLANEAARAGVEVMLGTSVVDLLPDGKGVRARNVDEAFDIEAKAVAGADGAYSLVARRAGLPVSRDPQDYGIGYHYEMAGVDHDPEYVDMYLGEDIAPGTYAWIIPKGGDVANVGTGVRVAYMKPGTTIHDYQRNFVEKHPIVSMKVSKAKITVVKAGCIPVGGPMERTSVNNVIAVGDAGGHTIPTVGGGIPPSLIVGRIAGQALANYVQDGAPISGFDEEWKRQLGETLYNSLRLRKMSDKVFKNERMIEFVTRRGWLTQDMVSKLVYCEIDGKVSLVERTMNRLFK